MTTILSLSNIHYFFSAENSHTEMQRKTVYLRRRILLTLYKCELCEWGCFFLPPDITINIITFSATTTLCSFDHQSGQPSTNTLY
jgi:hypothetical protein